MGACRGKLRFLTEFCIRIVLILLFIDLEVREPFTRVIQPEEVWLYRNPMSNSFVPGTWLWLMVGTVPTIVILTTYSITRDLTDLGAATMVITLATPLNGVITDLIKLWVGRPRPDFIYRCWPDGVVPANELPGDELHCTGISEDVTEGRKSFPSGHSSFSFVTWGFVFLYLSGKVGTFRGSSPGPSCNLLLLLGTLLVPLGIAISRTADYHHHWQDVVVGSIIGFAVALVVYRQYYPAISSPESHKPLASLSSTHNDITLASKPSVKHSLVKKLLP